MHRAAGLLFEVSKYILLFHALEKEKNSSVLRGEQGLERVSRVPALWRGAAAAAVAAL